MRIVLISIAAIAALLGIIMAILPFGTIGVLPGIVSLLAGIGAFYISKKKQKPQKLSLLFLTIGVLVIVASGSKSLWVKDEIAVDEEFEQKEEQSKEEAIEELKEIENELEEIEGDLEEIESE
ncbi:hypothetical protein J8L88_17840 [Aquimarina sp. MMG015]|uniref:hypothetical protein n=1 Tax=Aquimarina TaxID=290174 RepID=UPI0004289F20|nr:MULTISPECIES: hypothetical protein [Aquimarina]AXT54857.1 hypothetical protein D1815_03490 [Aquimarina sp. AD1]MBQ4804729.1 hypothetical protein [Aquimarina sp. MMG015]RKN12987.1 hypothetical protein D7035_18140 [Aquimarina sp. AD1]